MPVKNGGESDAEGDVSGGESERSNSSQGHESSDEEEEANECESDDSSELDSNDIELRRAEHLEDLASLERQFSQLREQYYVERINLIERQLSEVRSGRSEEFLQPLKELDKIYHTRIDVAEVLRRMRLRNIEHKFISEEKAAMQHFESEKRLAFDHIHDDLVDKIRRLEEDRHNVDISWADWGTDKRTNKVRGPGRKKAVSVTGPYIVYMLREEEIMEDWTTIRKAMKRSAATTVVAAAAGGVGAVTAVGIGGVGSVGGLLNSNLSGNSNSGIIGTTSNTLLSSSGIGSSVSALLGGATSSG